MWINVKDFSKICPWQYTGNHYTSFGKPYSLVEKYAD